MSLTDGMTLGEQDRLRRAIANVLQEHLEPMFKPECQLTFVMHVPGKLASSVFVSTGAMDDVIAAIEYLKSQPEIVGGGTCE